MKTKKGMRPSTKGALMNITVIAEMSELMTKAMKRQVLTRSMSIFCMSLESRFTILPVSVMSNHVIGERKTAHTALRCSERAAFTWPMALMPCRIPTVLTWLAHSSA